MRSRPRPASGRAGRPLARIALVAALLAGGSAGPPGVAQSCAIEVPEWLPRGTATSARPRISATITSTCGAAIDVSSIRMAVNDQVVTPRVEGSGPTVTVVHTPESALLEESDHTVTVRAADAKGTTGEKRWTFRLGDTYAR